LAETVLIGEEMFKKNVRFSSVERAYAKRRGLRWWSVSAVGTVCAEVFFFSFSFGTESGKPEFLPGRGF
jgi:hypothetical protein